MSKKKNTLKDLDEFLKQQAATLVSPAPLSAKVEEPQQSAPVNIPAETAIPEITSDKILKDLRLLAEKEGPSFRHTLYSLILNTLDKQRELPAEDKMLINTILYLKSGDQWKDVIRDYWRKKTR